MGPVITITPRGPTAPARGEEKPRRSSFEDRGGGWPRPSEPSSLVRPFGSGKPYSPLRLKINSRMPIHGSVS
jgi:hypothetical protein